MKNYATLHLQTWHNATHQWNVTQGSPQHDVAKMVRFAAKRHYIRTVSDIAKNYVTLRKLCYIVHTNVTQCNIWIKRDATKPTAWLSENVTLCGKKYVTLLQHYVVSKMSANMDLSLWHHCLVSAIFFRIESEATNVTSPGIHDKMLCEVAYPFCNCNGWNVQVLEWISFISHFMMNVITYPYWD